MTKRKQEELLADLYRMVQEADKVKGAPQLKADKSLGQELPSSSTPAIPLLRRMDRHFEEGDIPQEGNEDDGTMIEINDDMNAIGAMLEKQKGIMQNLHQLAEDMD